MSSSEHKSFIVGEVNINEKNVGKSLRILNSFEKWLLIHCNDDFEDDYNKYRNEKEIKENTEIEIDGNKIAFNYRYTFEKIGIYPIKYLFKNDLTNTSYMFCECDLFTLNFSDFNFENVTNMSNMFANSQSLTNLKFSNVNTQNVKDMKKMFINCKSLTDLNLSNFITKNVTNMIFMFSGCKSLTNLNLSNFNTENVTNMRCMFDGCKSLTNLNLSNFNTENVTNMKCMFDDCQLLTNLNLSNFNTQNVEKNGLNEMFDDCNSLKKENIITNDQRILKEFDNKNNN